MVNNKYVNNKLEIGKEGNTNSTYIVFSSFFTDNIKEKTKFFIYKNDINPYKYKRYFRYANNKKNIYKSNIFIFMIKILLKYFLMLDSIGILLSKSNFNNNISNSYEIILKVKGTGTKQILSGFYNVFPSEVYINNVKVNQSIEREVNITEEGSEIKLIWNEVITSAKDMFNLCDKIIEIDLTNFDTSTITNMFGMFFHCENLVSVNLSNFNTSNVKRMDSMFGYCYKLSSINLESFDTSSVTTFEKMFYECKSLTSINLSHFKTDLVKDINNMFYNNHKLTSIDLSNFNTQNITKRIVYFIIVQNWNILI